jgi:hypothetical protein
METIFYKLRYYQVCRIYSLNENISKQLVKSNVTWLHSYSASTELVQVLRFVF